MNRRKLVADTSLIVVISIIVILFISWIFIPMYTDYEFQTITKVSEPYENPIYLIFHWKTEDELQVGNLITLWIEIKGLPYTPENDLDKIKVNFLEKDLNYFNSETDLILPSDYVEFNPDWDSKAFHSNKIDLRFIVPDNISIQYCDYNQINSCMIIENIIHPAPHDLAVQINTNRIGLAISLIVVILSAVIVWATLRSKYVENRVIFESEIKQIKSEIPIETTKELEPTVENKFQQPEKFSDDDFYNKLKNAQPLAFLASLSIVIAAFTFNIQVLPKVYPNAIAAAFSFIFSFSLSMITQLLPKKDLEQLEFFLRMGVYFFLGVGMLYLIFIAIAFSETLSQIPEVFFAWIYGFSGMLATYLMWNVLKKIRNKENISFFDKLTLPSVGLVGLLSWISVGIKLTHAIIGIEIDERSVISLIVGSYSVLGIFWIIENILLIIKKLTIKKS